MHMFTLEDTDTDINALRACGYEHILKQDVPDVAAYHGGLARAAISANEAGDTKKGLYPTFPTVST